MHLKPITINSIRTKKKKKNVENKSTFFENLEFRYEIERSPAFFCLPVVRIFLGRKGQGLRANGAGRVGGLDEARYVGNGARSAGSKEDQRRSAVVGSGGGGHRWRLGMASVSLFAEREGIQELALTWAMEYLPRQKNILKK